MNQHSFYLADLQPLRQHLAQWGQLHQPRFEPDGVLRWIKTVVEEAYLWTDGVPLTSLKPFFFAERETVFVFDGQLFRSQLPSVPKRVFFGVKACDAAALAVQDRFFAEDSYYQARIVRWRGNAMNRVFFVDHLYQGFRPGTMASGA